MFETSFAFYDLMFSERDICSEAKKLKLHLQGATGDQRLSILDVACGTGAHISYLKDDFAIEGLDLDRNMLAIARSRNPEINFIEGDMIHFKIMRKFDVVTCLFSSIAYARTIEGLKQCILNMADHLNPNGTLIIEPFKSPELWSDQLPLEIKQYKSIGLNISRACHFIRDGREIASTYHFLIANEDKVEYKTEVHKFGLFEHKDYKEAFSEAGLDPIYDSFGLSGRGLYIAKK
jgi:SAM-dependent methyltransferase